MMARNASPLPPRTRYTSLVSVQWETSRRFAVAVCMMRHLSKGGRISRVRRERPGTPDARQGRRGRRRVVVGRKLEAASGRRSRSGAGESPRRIVIVGGGAAGFAAAEMLRRRGFAGELTMLSADDASPYDRPNLSKDYLAGAAPEEWIPLNGREFYAEKRIDLQLGT